MKATKKQPEEKPAEKPIVRVNWSTLRYLQISPKMLKWRTEHPEPETPALRVGRAIHCAVLEPGEFKKRWLIAGTCAAIKKSDGTVCASNGSLVAGNTWYCKTKGHAPDGAIAVPESMEVLNKEEADLVAACAASVREHRVASKLLKAGGLFEQKIEWTHEETGIACKGTIDFLRTTDVIDLKSTREEQTWGIEREIVNRLYYAQVAWYHDGAIAAKKLPADAPLPIIIAVSKCEPYDVAVYRMSNVAYRSGEILYRDYLLQYRDCMDSGLWPGIAPNLLELDVPDWAPGMNGSNYEGSEWS